MAAATFDYQMSFDLLAPYYRWMESILAGRKLHGCRIAFLDQIPAPRNILLLGEGHGRVLVECCRRFAGSQITYVDASERMLIEAVRQLYLNQLSSSHVKFIQADILNWSPPANTYDLIITNYFFDCFQPEQLAQMIPRIAASSISPANWLIADFQIPKAGLKRMRARMILWLLYAFFRATTKLSAHKLTCPDLFLMKAGFHLNRRINTDWSLLQADWWRSGQ